MVGRGMLLTGGGGGITLNVFPQPRTFLEALISIICSVIEKNKSDSMLDLFLLL